MAREPVEQLALPPHHVNCADLVERSPHVAKAWKKQAYVDAATGASLTYERLFELAGAVVRGLPLTYPDLFPGDDAPRDPVVVAIFSPNSLVYPVLALALPRIPGCVASTTNAALTPYECTSQWEASGADVLVCHPAVIGRAAEAWVGMMGRDPHRIVVADDAEVLSGHYGHGDDGAPMPDGFVSMGEVVELGMHALYSPVAGRSPPSPFGRDEPEGGAANGNGPPVPESEGDDAALHRPAFVLFSSGTTSGKSKPIAISHRNIVAVVLGIAHFETTLQPPAVVPGEDTVLGVVPVFHAFGMFNLIFVSMYLGLRTVLFPKFDAQRALAAIDEYGINIGFVVPPMLLSFNKHLSPDPPNPPHPTLRWLMSAAAPLLSEVIAATRRTFARPVLRNGFGMTELVATALSTLPGEEISEGQAGRALPNVEARVVDPHTGEDCAPGTAGELWIRAPQAVRSFWRLPGAGIVDDDGWLRTGDVAAFGEGGLAVRDRIKEMIKVNGLSVAPADVETVLLEHPYVHDAAVASVPHRSAGEAPKAYVVLEPALTAHLEPEEIRAELRRWCAQRMARYKQPEGGIAFVESVPKSASGKVLRRLLKD
ncbi:hypothetical protein DFJ74DRAFT_344820 [Hyaloraphidium curvatum]|nr:hypothetical protein DFJ74DRAFT_344820 [Hyaloraphidium curvatum]